MPDVVGIRFKNCGKIYNFAINGIEANKGDLVVVESEFGLGIGNVVIGLHSIENPEKELKKVIRLATDEDIKQKQDNGTFETETKNFCLERIMARGIPMKLICTEVTLDRKRIILYFTADGRIDFRELVKDLAAKFKTRIEMRQIGVRDKAKFIGGMGLCGKDLCCRVFLTSFEPISIKMAKQQELVLNTGKLLGICGRLMCCLGFEYDDPVTDSSSISDEAAILAADEGKLSEIVTEGTEQESSDFGEPFGSELRVEGLSRAGIVRSAAGTPADRSTSPDEKPSQQQTSAHPKRRRRRRRRRHKGKFKKSE